MGPLPRRAWLLLVVLGALAPNDDKRLAKDDLEFARALSSRGYPDLAEVILDALERKKGGASGSDDAQRAGVIRLDLEEAAAYREADPIKRAGLLAKVVESKEAFVKSNTGTLAADEVLNGLPDLYRGVGENIAAAIQKEESAAVKTELRTKGEAMFDRAIEAIKTQIEALKEKKLGQDPMTPDEDLDRQYMIATYNLARTHYFHALLLGPTSELQPLVLQLALDVLSEFALDFSDQLLCYEGYIYEGLCHKELLQPEQAIESFDAAIELRTLFEQNRDGLYEVGPMAADIISSAVLQKMLLLSAAGDHAGAAAVAADFYATIPDAHQALKGLAVLAAQAEAYKSLGDDKALDATAKKLVEVDPRGPAGELGRELLKGGGGSTLGTSDIMRLAEASLGRGDNERAAALCQEAMILARGTADEANQGARAGLLLGSAFFQMKQYHEAVIAWDASATRYSKGKDAPECLWRTVNGYIFLQEREARHRPYYKRLTRDRMTALVEKYPTSQYASQAAIIEGLQLEAEQEFAQAAATFERVAPGTAAYEEALYRAGNSWSRLAQDAFKRGKPEEAKTAVAKAETLLKKARTELEASASRTLDLGQQNRLRGWAFSARVSLANMYLLEGVNRAVDVAPLFDGVESEFPDDENKLNAARNLRLKSLQALGKLDEALALLDKQVRDDPDNKSIGPRAAALAQALDAHANELRSSDPKSAKAEEMWRKAASYYVLAVRAQLEGKEAVRIDELEAIANRLFALALKFGRVPEDVQSFADSTTARPEKTQLEQAVRIYETVLPLTPSYRTVISLARALGFLGRWSEAATHYAELFSQQRFADTTSRTIDSEALRAKPELIFAYLEWGVCEREVGVKDSDTTRLSRAASIFETLVVNTVEGTDLWWKAKYFQLRTLTDRGDYEVADVALRYVERNFPDYDGGKLHLADRFRALKEELSRKVFRK